MTHSVPTISYQTHSMRRACYRARFSSRLTHFALHQTSLAAREAQAIAPAQSAWNAATSSCTILTSQRSMRRACYRARFSSDLTHIRLYHTDIITHAVSNIRFEKPHSLSYQDTTFTKLPITRVSNESTVDDAEQ